MSGGAVAWALPTIAFVAIWIALVPVSFALHRLARRPLAAIAPAERSTLLLALTALPLSVAALVAVLGFTPSLGGWIVDPHCHADTGCAPHVPIRQAAALYALPFGVVLLATAAGLGSSAVRRLRRTQRLASALGSLAEPAARERFEIIDSDEPFAYCVGLWRPKIVVSRGLTRRLTAEQLGAVVAHEQAHAARRDNLRHGLASLCALPLGPGARRLLLGDLALASEQACDQRAAARTSAGTVQTALEALEPAHRTHARAVTFEGAEALASRCGALLAGASGAPPAGVVPAAIAVAYAVATLLTAYLAHHGIEIVLGWLA